MRFSIWLVLADCCSPFGVCLSSRQSSESSWRPQAVALYLDARPLVDRYEAFAGVRAQAEEAMSAVRGMLRERMASPATPAQVLHNIMSTLAVATSAACCCDRWYFC